MESEILKLAREYDQAAAEVAELDRQFSEFVAENGGALGRAIERKDAALDAILKAARLP